MGWSPLSDFLISKFANIRIFFFLVLEKGVGRFFAADGGGGAVAGVDDGLRGKG